MSTFELATAFALGISSMLCAAWVIGVKSKTALFLGANSISASAILLLCTVFFDTGLKLNAFSMYSSALFGFGGLIISYLMNIF
ncbi:MAG: hypothetical protein EOM87_00515 [Clostridia bacterium]|nr:hypothetical protein [Clostridia bacterium]